MAVRTDIEINWDTSPRIITVLSASTEVTVQDIVDTAREAEDELVNMDNAVLVDPVNTGGKQDLGDGVQVDISCQLNDAQISFQNRAGTVLESGSITTATAQSTSGTIALIDSGAYFLTSGSSRQDIVINWTDRSICTILDAPSENQLNCTPLSGGTDNDWGVSDVYAIYPVEQCSVAGGNLVAVDVTGSSISSVFQTFGTQIVRTSSASATRVNQESLEIGSFLGGVAVHTVSGSTGTAFPIGTRQQPALSLVNAKSIAEERGFNTFFLLNGQVLNDGLDFSKGFIFKGDSPVSTFLTVNPDINVENCEFVDCTISGTLDGGNIFRQSSIVDINYVNGFVFQCGFLGSVTLGGGADAHILQCYSLVPGDVQPVINLGGAGQSLGLRDYTGGVRLVSGSGDDQHSIDMSAGHVVLDPSIVSGTFIIRGNARLTDNSGIGATVLTGGLMQGSEDIAEHVWDIQLTPAHTGSNTAGEFLFGAGGGASPTVIADAVWNTAIVGHTGSNTFGELVAKKLLKFSLWLALK